MRLESEGKPWGNSIEKAKASKRWGQFDWNSIERNVLGQFDVKGKQSNTKKSLAKFKQLFAFIGDALDVTLNQTLRTICNMYQVCFFVLVRAHLVRKNRPLGGTGGDWCTRSFRGAHTAH